MRKIALVLLALLPLFSFAQKQEAKITFVSKSDTLYVGFQNEIKIETKLNHNKITIECEGTTYTRRESKDLIFAIIAPTMMAGKMVEIKVKYVDGKNARVIASKKVKVTTYKKRP